MIFLFPKVGYVSFLDGMIKICEWNLKNQKCWFYGCMGNDGALPYLFPQHRGVPYLKDWSYLDRSFHFTDPSSTEQPMDSKTTPRSSSIFFQPNMKKNVSSKNICWNLGSSSRSWGISTSGSSWISRCQKAIAALMPKQQSSLFFCLTCSGWWI